MNLTHSEIAGMIANITRAPGPQTLDLLSEILTAQHSEIGALQAQVRKWKGFDDFKIGNGSRKYRSKNELTELSTKIRGEGESGSAVGPATAQKKSRYRVK